MCQCCVSIDSDMSDIGHPFNLNIWCCIFDYPHSFFPSSDLKWYGDNTQNINLAP